MDNSLSFLCLFILFVKGVCGDEVKSVLVMKGYSLTLHTDIIKQKDDMIVWRYGPNNTFIARMNGEVSNNMLSDDERFRDKVKMNNQTGDLTITHITTQHNGVYTLKISSNNKVSYKKFDVTVRGEVMSVSVREGHPVTLYTHILKESDDVMEWRFGPEKTLVSEINGMTGRTRLSDDERFRDRVKRDDQTGDLMISDIRPHHSGLYQFRINSDKRVSYKTFDVTVHDSPVDARGLWVWVIPVVLVLAVTCACVCAWVCTQKDKIKHLKLYLQDVLCKTLQATPDSKSSMNFKKTFDVERIKNC